MGDAVEGVWLVQWQSTAIPGYVDVMPAIALMRDGKITGTDAAGMLWRGVYDLQPDGRLRFAITIDPRTAGEDYVVWDEAGVPSRLPQTFRVELRPIVHKGTLKANAKIQRGEITLDVALERIWTR